MVIGPAWRERNNRVAWFCRYTVVGGRARGIAQPDDAVARFSQQAFVASPKALRAVDPKCVALAQICMRLLQRGHMPPVAPSIERQLDALLGEVDPATASDLVGAAAPEWTLDPSFELHETFEKPFWDHAAQEPELARWITPQASLEALAKKTPRDSADRWADFLLHHPLLPKAHVVEIDGPQHERALGVDKQRDQLLGAAGHSVSRQKGEKWRALFDELPLAGLLGASAPPGATERRRAALAPTTVHRFVFAISEGLRVGLLDAAAPWVIEICDPLDVAAQCAGPALDLLASVDALYGFGVVPQRFTVNRQTWTLNEGRFERGACEEQEPVALRIVLDPDRPPHAALPGADGRTIVVRHAFLPVELPFESDPGKRHPIAPNPDDTLLERLAVDLFGVDELRVGQAEAMRKVFAGRDSLVLIPTGGGKSLIYQLVGLLLPGLTLVVAPIVALIDDQGRRLREEGVDRVLALHGSLKARVNQRQIIDDIVRGGALFAFVTPERLQIAGFRSALQDAAQQRLVGLAVVDEAHCVSEWGHDFRTAYLRLGGTIRELSKDSTGERSPILAMTGTASRFVQEDICRDLNINLADVFRPAEVDRPNLHYSVVRRNFRATQPLQEAIRDCASPRAGDSGPRPGIVFNQTVDGQHGLLELRQLTASSLNISIDEVDFYCGRPPENFAGPKALFDRVKAKSAERFMCGKTNAMVATKAFGMGVDKNDVRWTVHVGMPNSIEAFAQEAGRAGRDGKEAHCVIVATPPNGPLASSPANLLQNVGNSDIGILNFFLNQSFLGEPHELDTCRTIIGELFPEQVLCDGQFKIPRFHNGTPTKKQDAEAKSREKALYRLILLDVVDHYTVDFGSRQFTVQLKALSTDHIDRALLEQAQRLDDDKIGELPEKLRVAPQGLIDRVEHHVGILIGIIYRRIRPTRERAIYNMYRMVADDLTPEQFRQRLNGYLSHGQLAASLGEQSRPGARIDIDGVMDSLSAVPADDAWRGAADRQLEDTPEHPVALLADALAEAWSSRGDRARFSVALGDTIETLHSRGVSDADTARLVRWLLRQLKDRKDGWRRPWRLDVWLALDGRFLGEAAIEEEERAVLNAPLASPDETTLVLTRRMATAARLFKAWAAE